jgi:hypothetical protein
MKHLFTVKTIAAGAVVLGAITLTSNANARSEAYILIDVPLPGIHVQHAPVFSQPRHVVQGASGHSSQFNDERDEWRRRQDVNVYGRHDRHGLSNIYNTGRLKNHWHHQHRIFGPYGDLDRDGIKNRYDRDRDGDGIPNRYDRRPDYPRGR